MTIAPNRPAEPGTVRQRVRFAAARTGPRAVRVASETVSATRGFAVAAGMSTAVAVVFACWAWVSHPRWSRLGTRVADLLCRRTVLAVTAGLALLDVTLLARVNLLAVLFVAPPLLVWGVRAARVALPHTVRGRVRARYGLDGWASWWDIHRNLSAHAARQVAATMRPTLVARLPHVDDTANVGQRAALTARRRIAVELLPARESGTWLGRTAAGPVIGRPCFVPHRDVIGLVAPPQTAKTALMTHHVIDHPGAVFTTSTKPDVYQHTAALRQRRSLSGRVEVFNPESLGGLTSTMRWSPVRGCADPATAAERAGALVGATSAAGGEDGTFWLDSAAKVLRAFLLAADLDGRDMRSVQRWVANPVGTGNEALDVLATTHREQVPAGWADDLAQVLRTDAKRTRESIFLTLSQSVAFMADPLVAAAVCPGPEEPVFDVASFLYDRSTLYLIMSERPHASIAPLAAAFTTDLFETAKRIAAGMPKGRLDAPLGMVLDEIALTTPVPLDRWVADAGGRGIHIVWSCQSPSQLAQRWGKTGADTIWNATNAKVIFGGLSLDADLEAISRLCGERHQELVDDEGKTRRERVRVLPINDLRELPQVRRGDGRIVVFALLIHRATAPTIVRITPGWERADVRAAGQPAAQEPINRVLRVQLDDETEDGR